MNGSSNKQQRSALENDNESSLEELTGNYCEDFYNYLKNNTKRFFDSDILELELSPKFSYYDLDYLKETPAKNFFSKTDDELYQIYEKSYKLDHPNAMLSDYMIWIIENKCYLIDKFVLKLGKIFDKINPFKRDMYILNHYTYLYNRRFVNSFNTFYDINENIERSYLFNRTDEYKRINTFDRI